MSLKCGRNFLIPGRNYAKNKRRTFGMNAGALPINLTAMRLITSLSKKK